MIGAERVMQASFPTPRRIECGRACLAFPLHLAGLEMASFGTFLMQVAAAQHDTLIMKQVLPARGIFETITAIASAIITVAFLALLIVAFPVMWHLRKMNRKINHLLDRVHGDISPLMHHLNAIADNVNFVTASIRADMQKVNATIATANERVQQAVSVTEDRLHEFNALLAVVQDEAEQVFVSTASAVRGVRGGAAAFASGRRGGMDLASEELDAAALADEIENRLESEEEDDGDDGSSEPSAQAFSARESTPRVRPRSRSTRRGGGTGGRRE